MLPVPSPGGGRIFCHDYSYRGPTYNDSLFLRGIVRSRSRLTRRDSDQAADPPESWTRRPTVVTPHGPRLTPAQRVSTGAREARRGTWDAQDLRQSQHSAKGDSKKTGNPLTGAFTRPQPCILAQRAPRSLGGQLTGPAGHRADGQLRPEEGAGLVHVPALLTLDTPPSPRASVSPFVTWGQQARPAVPAPPAPLRLHQPHRPGAGAWERGRGGTSRGEAPAGLSFLPQRTRPAGSLGCTGRQTAAAR